MGNCKIVSEKFIENKKLYHFTTFENLRSIIENGTLYMSKLDSNLNDKNEITYIPEYSNGKIFITCFTATMNEKFWESEDYAKNSSVGVCICFDTNRLIEIKVMSSSRKYLDFADRMSPNYNSYENESDYRIRNLIFDKVIYVDDPKKEKIFDNQTYNFFHGCVNIDESDLRKYCETILNYGFKKTILDSEGQDQSYEDEYRILARILHKGSEVKWQNERKEFPRGMFDRLLIDIKFLIPTLEIIVKKDFSFFNELERLSNEYDFKYRII